MAPIVLGRKEYRDKVYACWLGKNIGGTLGAPYECGKYVNNLTFYDPVPTEPLPNDDLDLQLVWLQMLEERGKTCASPTSPPTGPSTLPPILGTNMASARGTSSAACCRRSPVGSRTTM